MFKIAIFSLIIVVIAASFFIFSEVRCSQIARENVPVSSIKSFNSDDHFAAWINQSAYSVRRNACIAPVYSFDASLSVIEVVEYNNGTWNTVWTERRSGTLSTKEVGKTLGDQLWKMRFLLQ